MISNNLIDHLAGLFFSPERKVTDELHAMIFYDSLNSKKNVIFCSVPQLLEIHVLCYEMHFIMAVEHATVTGRGRAYILHSFKTLLIDVKFLVDATNSVGANKEVKSHDTTISSLVLS